MRRHGVPKWREKPIGSISAQTIPSSVLLGASRTRMSPERRMVG